MIRLDDQLHIYRDGVYVDTKRVIEGEMVKLIPALTQRNRNEVYSYLDITTQDTLSKSSANYIAFNNGIYNLDTDTLEDFDPDIIVKNKIPHDYNTEAYNETMDTVLNNISCQDQSIRDLLEEMAGYCLYRRNELRKSFILIGDKANGKSTYLDCIGTMIGDDSVSS